ncbi:Uncharacterized protein FWK35_00037650 [Aphis craccivora]|uniref:Uncharacterized protein n=1 Tax=Aphis craccivora TaxID=307492 RepID=A0A6G0VII7_APHCR|nr:Uncharacterized protein FWK35_00037650 [Aphis craccivora]
MLEQYETSINDLTSNNVIVFNIDADNEVFVEENENDILNSPTDLLVNSQKATCSSFDDQTWNPSCASKLLKTTPKHTKLTGK